MGFNAAMNCLYLIAGNINLLWNIGNYLSRDFASFPRRITYRCQVTSYEIGGEN
jgi:hypothetical protein